MTLNTGLAGQVNDWLLAEGKNCRSERDLDVACERFLERWPRVHPKILHYVSQMLIAQLHVRTFKSSQILDRARDRIARSPNVRRRWWQMAWGGSRA